MYPGTHAVSTPDKAAYIMGGTGRTVTYKELDDRSNQLAQLLYQRGLRRGDGMALCMENNDTFYPVTWAGACVRRFAKGGPRSSPVASSCPTSWDGASSTYCASPTTTIVERRPQAAGLPRDDRSTSSLDPDRGQGRELAGDSSRRSRSAAGTGRAR